MSTKIIDSRESIIFFIFTSINFKLHYILQLLVTKRAYPKVSHRTLLNTREKKGIYYITRVCKGGKPLNSIAE